MDDTEDEMYDVVVIGAGLSGIAFARFYLDVHPDATLLLLESDDCIGGVWSKSRVFDGFWSQSGERVTGFSDMPFTVPADAPRYYDTYEAKYVTHYLERYVRDHVYQERPLQSRIRLGCDVQAINKTDETWMVTSRRGDSGALETLRSRFLAVASGLTSRPKVPSLPQRDRFRRPVVHQKDFGRMGVRELADSHVSHVAVLGGGKSAADMAYIAAKAGKKVAWIIPPEGKGPAILMNPRAEPPYRNAVEVAMTRRGTAANPSCFAVVPDQRPSLKDALAKSLDRDQQFRDFADYHGRAGALASFRDLAPRTSYVLLTWMSNSLTGARFFWSDGPVGMVQHEDFWDTIAQKVQIHRRSVLHLEDSCVLLEGDVALPADVLLCGTGWRADYPFFTDEQAYSLGLPCDPSLQSPTETQKWAERTREADAQILQDHPLLAYPPAPGRLPSKLTPARLYEGIASLTDSSIVFLGRAHISNAFRGAEAQAIWATAYLDGNLPLPPLEEACRRVAYINAFSKWRYPAYGADGLYFFNDLLGYTDKLLRDVGLHSHRKEWWSEWDAPCLASDLRDAKDEYLSLPRRSHCKEKDIAPSLES